MKAAVAIVALPAAAVLLIGAAMEPPPPPATTAIAPASYPTDLPAPAVAFTGSSAGCTEIDPTGTGGCVTPATVWLLTQVELAFGPLPTSCWDAHAWNPTSDHPRGKGCDVTFGRIGRFPGPEDVQRGWLLAEWLRVNALATNVSYLIWQGLIWSAGRNEESWRPYSGGGVYDPADATGGHYDHIHISTAT